MDLKTATTTLGAIAVSTVVGYGALTTPIEVPWTHSETTFAVDTRSGDLEQGQYVNVDTGQLFFNIDGVVRDFHDQEEYRLGEVLALKERKQKGYKHMDVFADGTRLVTSQEEYEAVKSQRRKPERTKRVLTPTAEAIAITGTSSVHTSYVNSITLATTCSGDNRGIVTAIGTRTQTDITGITYNGVAMVQEVMEENASVAGVSIWALKDASTGSNNVVLSNSQFRLHTMYNVCMSGTDTADIVEAVNGSGGYGASRTVATSSVTNSAWFVSAINTQGTQTLTVDSGETELYNSDNSDANLGQVGVSYFEKATAGSETLGWSWSGDDNNEMALVVVKPAGEAGTSTPAVSGGQDVWFF